MAPKKIAQTVLTEGKFYTISAANGKVIEVADYNIDNGAKIQLMDNANFEWQQWNFVAAGDGVYRIQNRFTGKMMDLDMGGVSDGTRVHQWEGAQASSYYLDSFENWNQALVECYELGQKYTTSVLLKKWRKVLNFSE